MTKEIGTNDLINSWAANGTKVEPDNIKKDIGWKSSEVPPFQTMNFLQNLFCKKINYLMRSGIPAWNNETTYEVNDLVTVSGVVYIAENQNTNSQPPNINWKTINPKNNLNANSAPTENNDASEGYEVNSLWIDQSVNPKEIYRMAVATIGSAVWLKTTLSSDELGTLAFLNEVPDNSITKEKLDFGLVGAVNMFAMPTAPTGWLVCDGSAVSRTTYADLYAVIGDIHGDGDGSTTFNLPDLRGEFVRGYDDGASVDAGRVFGSKQQGTLAMFDKQSGIGIREARAKTVGDEIASSISADTANASDYPNVEELVASGTVETLGQNSVIGQSRPRNVALLFCIKT